jgi:hypothetical protein
MSLTPKNWGTFQHYKDRAPAWIKLHRGLLDDFTFHRLPLASRALAPLLWLLASEYEHGAITADFDEIAFRFRMPVDDLRKAVTPLIDSGFFLASEPLADCKRDACLEKEEEGEKEEEIDTRSKGRPASAPNPKQIDLEDAIAAAPKRAPSRFDEFWKAYPRRDGPNPRKPAESRFNTLVKTGLDPEMLIAEAKKLAVEEGKRGNVGTRFIPQAATWLNQQRWSDHAAVAFLVAELSPAERAKAEAEQLDAAVAFFARTGVWSRHVGASPDLPGCRASPALLAKYGLGPDGRKLPPRRDPGEPQAA